MELAMPCIKLTALAATMAVGGAAALPAAGVATARRPGKHTVIVNSAYVTREPGKIFDGTLFKGQTFKVTRLSKSGKYAYGYAYGHVNRKDWIEAKALGPKK